MVNPSKSTKKEQTVDVNTLNSDVAHHQKKKLRKKTKKEQTVSQKIVANLVISDVVLI
jgi:hypothetical protein